MPIPPKTAQRAAYTLHQRHEAPQGFNSLYDLREALRKLPGAREIFEYHWGYRDHPGVINLDIRVYGRDGGRRMDLEDPLHRIYSHWHQGDIVFDENNRPRGNPIMGTGKRRHYRYSRKPHTQRDRRMGFPVFDEGEPPIRGNRKPCLLPTRWDDLPRQSWRDRSWKRFRVTQWR